MWYNDPTIRYILFFTSLFAILFVLIYVLFYEKETNYVHPGLYIQKNPYGLGVYTKQDIPENTVILQKSMFYVDTPNIKDKEYTEYCFLLIKHILQSSYKDEFLTFVPDRLDETTNVYDYDDIREYHLKYLPHLDESTMMLYYYKLTRNVFKFNDQSATIFGYGTRFNHACDFNTTYTIDETSKRKDVMVFTTTRDISAGEEIFIPYIDVTEYETVEERMEHLKQNYGFDCGCSFCKSV